eukprot:CAMPEP_0114262416 /NCGR_PEP_ID=MMETSP0058-20121206/21792_1 /TAXON_ID=36894 /ORGANISM="Pyramimonas parkeae, CCMP726" /LENGTH=40 /DNA_ID= /DNA_START= /DNA_END= /DNA_ORIENTATION=
MEPVSEQMDKGNSSSQDRVTAELPNVRLRSGEASEKPAND